MPIAIVTGSGGLIGSESVIHLAEPGWTVIGIENDMRARFFGREASTARISAELPARFRGEFRSEDVDIRDADAVERAAGAIGLTIHAAAQPSHDWAASDPQTDFAVNANRTLNLLEAGRELDWSLADEHRVGDHRWWISDVSDFKRDYPAWDIEHDVDDILREIHDPNVEHWAAA